MLAIRWSFMASRRPFWLKLYVDSDVSYIFSAFVIIYASYYYQLGAMTSQECHLLRQLTCTGQLISVFDKCFVSIVFNICYCSNQYCHLCDGVASFEHCGSCRYIGFICVYMVCVYSFIMNECAIHGLHCMLYCVFL